MRKPLGLLIAALLVLTVVPASAEIPGREEQFERGSVNFPTRFTDGEGGWPGLGRRVWLCSADSNGQIAYVFEVFEETWGGAFVLEEVADDTGSANVDVFFYEEFGDCGGAAAPITSAEFAERTPGGEVGIVPDRATKAVVFTPDGLRTSFTYAGYAPPDIRLGRDSLDVTVAKGARVEWTNTTDDYAYVRHTPDDGQVLFDSSPAQGTGIPVGATWAHRFSDTGTFPYETPVGSGTVTVVDSVRDLQ